MADISAADVMKLRKMSGQGMMDCKKALAETDGDIEAAMTMLRKKGLATLEKRAGRDTTEGRVVCVVKDASEALMGTLCCETDFVSKSDDFAAAAEAMKEYMQLCPADEGAEVLEETEKDGKKFSQIITDCVSKTGEKTEVGDFVRYKLDTPGLVASYVHFNGKIGVMIEIETDSQDVAGNEDFATVARDICMHIAAINPLALSPDDLDAETVEKERAIAAEQVKDKPAEIIDKIVDGKMKKYFAENCLLAQGFVKDEKTSVEDTLNAAAKKAGGGAKIKRFVRLAIG